VAPLLVGDKLAAVRAYNDAIEDAAPETLHALRIAFKELRYTLEFFEPVMGPTAGIANETVKQILTHLGDLNDARIHLEMLAKSNAKGLGPGLGPGLAPGLAPELAPGLAPAIDHYSSIKMTELARLTAEFPVLWSSFDRPEWRQDLYTAIAVL
jgi:CHAD domain-containing protein